MRDVNIRACLRWDNRILFRAAVICFVYLTQIKIYPSAGIANCPVSASCFLPCRYILWTEENVPKGGRDIGTLLERCIKEFQDVTKYENDERYLNVWLKYVSDAGMDLLGAGGCTP